MIHLPTGVGLTDAENGELQIKHGRVLRTSCMATVMWWAWVWHPSAWKKAAMSPNPLIQSPKRPRRWLIKRTAQPNKRGHFKPGRPCAGVKSRCGYGTRPSCEPELSVTGRRDIKGQGSGGVASPLDLIQAAELIGPQAQSGSVTIFYANH